MTHLGRSEMLPADIVVIPPLADHHGVHCGGSSYAVIRLDPRELPQIFGGDPWLSDAENWQEKNRFRADPNVGLIAGQGLSRLAHHLARQAGVLSEGAAEFWRRTIVEYMAMTISRSIPVDKGGHLASATRACYNRWRAICGKPVIVRCIYRRSVLGSVCPAAACIAPSMKLLESAL